MKKAANRSRTPDDEIERLRAENEVLRNLHSRNVRHLARRKYKDIGHHCGWRVIAEAMAGRSQRALQTKDSPQQCHICPAPPGEHHMTCPEWQRPEKDTK